MAALGAFAWGAFVRKHKVWPGVRQAVILIGVGLVCLLTLPLFDSGGYPALFVEAGLDWLWIVLLAWVCTVFAHAYYIHLLRSLTAYTMNLAFNFEPIYGIVAAALIFKEHENLHPAFYLGALTILAANLLHPRLQRRIRSGASSIAG